MEAKAYLMGGPQQSRKKGMTHETIVIVTNQVPLWMEVQLRVWYVSQHRQRQKKQRVGNIKTTKTVVELN